MTALDSRNARGTGAHNMAPRRTQPATSLIVGPVASCCCNSKHSTPGERPTSASLTCGPSRPSLRPHVGLLRFGGRLGVCRTLMAAALRTSGCTERSGDPGWLRPRYRYWCVLLAPRIGWLRPTVAERDTLFVWCDLGACSTAFGGVRSPAWGESFWSQPLPGKRWKRSSWVWIDGLLPTIAHCDV